MFDRIKKAFGKDAKPEAAPSSMLHAGPVSEWAATRGFGFSVDDTGLPEEMRWLAMYDEVGWESQPEA